MNKFNIGLELKGLIQLIGLEFSHYIFNESVLKMYVLNKTLLIPSYESAYLNKHATEIYAHRENQLLMGIINEFKNEFPLTSLFLI